MNNIMAKSTITGLQPIPYPASPDIKDYGLKEGIQSG